MDIVVKYNGKPAVVRNGKLHEVDARFDAGLPMIAPCHCDFYAKSDLLDVSILSQCQARCGVSRAVLDISNFCFSVAGLFDSAPDVVQLLRSGVSAADVLLAFLDAVDACPVRYHAGVDPVVFALLPPTVQARISIVLDEPTVKKLMALPHGGQIDPALSFKAQRVQFANQKAAHGNFAVYAEEMLRAQIDVFGDADFEQLGQLANYQVLLEDNMFLEPRMVFLRSFRHGLEPIHVIGRCPAFDTNNLQNLRFSQIHALLFKQMVTELRQLEDFVLARPQSIPELPEEATNSFPPKLTSAQQEYEEHSKAFDAFNSKCALNTLLVCNLFKRDSIKIVPIAHFEELSFAVKTGPTVVVYVWNFQAFQLAPEGVSKRENKNEINPAMRSRVDSFLANPLEQCIFWRDSLYFVVRFNNVEDYVLLERFIQENSLRQKLSVADVLERAGL